jgi:hypothetical protein
MVCASELDQQLSDAGRPARELRDQTVDRMGGLRGTETMPLASAGATEDGGTGEGRAVTGGAQTPTAAWQSAQPLQVPVQHPPQQQPRIPTLSQSSSEQSGPKAVDCARATAWCSRDRSGNEPSRGSATLPSARTNAKHTPKNRAVKLITEASR